jgi:hypothetical protein
MSEVTLEQNLTAARQEHLVPGREIHVQDMRGQRFGEVGLVTGTSPDNAVVNIWNTLGACDPTVEQFDALDVAMIARESGAMSARLDPIRRALFDRLDIAEAGDDRTFADITGTWIGAVGATTPTHTADLDRYDPGYVFSRSTFTFSRGSRVYVLDAPDGEVFVLHSLTAQTDPELGEGDLTHLIRRLDLPGGWGFRAETVDEDLAVEANPDDLAHLIQDSLRNVYVGSDAGRAFSLLAPRDSLW